MSAPGVWCIRFSRTLRFLIAVAIISGLSLSTAFVQRHARIPIPDSILGMGLLFLLLSSGVLSLNHVKPGSDWLLAEMVLFFVPAVVGVVRFFPVIATYGGRLLIAIILGTSLVMTSTALAVEAANRMQTSIREKRLRSSNTSNRATLKVVPRDVE